MDAKTKAIVAHITLIGWIIALVVNNQEKDELTSFYIRQVLGLMIIGLLGMIPFLGFIAGIVVLIGWVISLIGAAQGEMKPIPVLGEYFQEWFSGIS
jgi:uncharacterized membrane protein